MVASMNIHDVTKITVSSRLVNPPHGPVQITEYTFHFQDSEDHCQSITITAFLKQGEIE
jgi:hypothetical protein